MQSSARTCRLGRQGAATLVQGQAARAQAVPDESRRQRVEVRQARDDRRRGRRRAGHPRLRTKVPASRKSRSNGCSSRSIGSNPRAAVTPAAPASACRLRATSCRRTAARLTLRNRPEGGLIAELRLPRRQASGQSRIREDRRARCVPAMPPTTQEWFGRISRVPTLHFDRIAVARVLRSRCSRRVPGSDRVDQLAPQVDLQLLQVQGIGVVEQLAGLLQQNRLRIQPGFLTLHLLCKHSRLGRLQNTDRAAATR